MSLELQLSTRTAREELAGATKSVDSFMASVARLSQAANQIEAISGRLASIKGINSAAVASVNELANSINKLSNKGRLDAAAAGLQEISRVNVAPAAAGVKQLADALGQVKAPRGLGAIGNHIAKIGNETRMAEQSTRNFGAALAAVNGSRLGAVGTGARQAAAGLREGASAANSFGTAMRIAQGTLAAFGVSAIAQSIVQFGKASLDASANVTQFKIQIDTATGVAGSGTAAYERLNTLVDKLAIPLDVATRNFGKLSVAMAQTGHSVDTAFTVFEGFGTAFRTYGLNADQMNRAFNAIQQTFNKGAVSAEELKNQLGEVFPAFNELAQSAGTSGQALLKMMAAGQVSSEAFIKLAYDLREKYAKSLEEAGKTGQAAMVRLGTAITRLQVAVGDTLFNALTASINTLAQTIQSPAFANFAVMLAQIAGIVGGVLVSAFQTAVSAFNIFASTVSIVVNAFTALFSYVNQFVPIFSFLGQVISGVSAVLGGIAPTVIAAVAGFYALSAAITITSRAVLFMTEAWRAWQTAGGVLRLLFSQTAVVVAALVAGFAALAVVAETLFRVWEYGVSMSEAFNATLSAWTDRLGSAREAVSSLVPQVDTLTGSTQESASAADLAAESSGNAAQSFSDAGSKASGAARGVDSLTSAYQRNASAARSASSAQAQVTTRQTGGNTDEYVWRGDKQFLKGSDALAEYDAWSASGDRENADIQRLNNRDGSFNWSETFFSRGGLRNTSNPGSLAVRTRVPASVFANAPHFADGTANTSDYPQTLSGGGIPAVLHPNEAVIPLTGGGSVPVELGGGGAAPTSGANNAPNLEGMIYSIYECLTEIKAEVVRVWESVDTLMALEKAQWAIQHKWSEKIANNLLSGSGGSFGGGGTGGTGGTGGARDLSGIQADFKDTQRSIQDNLAGWKRGDGRGLGYRDSQGKFWAQYEYSPDYEANNQISRNNERLKQEFVDKYGEKAYYDMLYPQGWSFTTNPITGRREVTGRGANNSLGVFETGSPNASRDVGGGAFTATLHPDEAVIPLPDGRTVPVKMPDSLMRQLDDIESRVASPADFDGGPSIAGGTMNRYNVTIHVNTPDANSFRKSQAQIVGEMRGQLMRNEKVKAPSRVRAEDPTKRSHG